MVLNSLAGKGVHVVTVNDYLARRDAEWMGPIYEMLGRVGRRAAEHAVLRGQAGGLRGRRHLRHQLRVRVRLPARQHGHGAGGEGPARATPYAIVDEVDNILIDEARTPLIISGAPEQAADLYDTFARLARQMKPGKTPEGMDPRAKKEFVPDFDFEFDEKHKTVSVTEQGVAKAERFVGIQHLYRAENGHLVNHLHQSLKAESLYKRDVDYAVIDGEVKIIDEFTGRILEGRRWSEGLHQAVEAKEGVRVQEENQTLATVTLQNYFRMYDKLAGMTGTAITEATEFMKIYKLAVVEIPTNMPMVRDDRNDQVYKTKDGKWAAVLNEIVARHEAGQPVLVGTVSVEVSELLGERLNRKGIQHTVLNAKPEHAEREGEIIAEAGQAGAVTIATNMAGRGVDIKLGGNADHLTRLELAKLGLQPGDPDYDERFKDVFPSIDKHVEGEREKVVEAGGLFICGTERHEARRIDNQLRGRSGRQGDPGESRFFLSAEDDLVRLFAGNKIYSILDRLGTTDDEGNEEPIEAKMLSKQIEKAQRKVEEQNFLIRKRVLEYDDVMNQQREIVYKYRDEVLEGRDMGEPAREQIAEVIGRMVEEYTSGDFIEDWDLDGLFTAIEDIWPTTIDSSELDPNTIDREELIQRLSDDAGKLYERARGGARVRAHARARALPAAPGHRPALARAPLRHGLPARGHPPPRVRPDRPARRLQERGLRALPGPDEHDLVGLRADDLQRRGRGGGRERRRRHPDPDALGRGDADGRRQRLLLRRHEHAQRLRHGRHGGGRGRSGRGRGGRGGDRGHAGGPAARGRREPADRAQRPVLVRLREEVQEVPRGLTA